MKSVILALLISVMGSSFAYSSTCADYFNNPLTNLRAQERSRLQELRSQMALARTISRSDLAREIHSEEYAKVRGLVERLEVLIQKQLNVLKHDSFTKSIQRGSILNAQARARDLSQKIEILKRNSGLLMRIFNRSEKAVQRYQDLKRLTQELKALRERIYSDEVSLSARMGQFANFTEPAIQHRLREHQDIRNQLLSDVQFLTEQKVDAHMAAVNTHKTEIQKEQESIIRDFATEWVLARHVLVQKVESYRGIYEQQVCAAGVCSTLGTELLSSLGAVQTALAKATHVQKIGVLRDRVYDRSTSLRQYIEMFVDRSAQANSLRKSSKVDAPDIILIDTANSIVKNRNKAFSKLEDIFKTLETFLEKADIALSGVNEPGAFRMPLLRERAQFEKTLIVVQELATKADELKSRRYISTKQFRDLAKMVVEATTQVESLMMSLQNTRQVLDALLDVEGLAAPERAAVEDLLRMERVGPITP